MDCRQLERLARCPIRPLCTGAILAAVLVAGAASAGDKTDVISFKNGDRLTGEVKSLDRGKISFDTDAAGVIKVEWDDIEQLFSTTTYEVTLQNGERLYGTL